MASPMPGTSTTAVRPRSRGWPRLVLTRAHRLDDHAVEAGPADELDDVGQGGIVLAADGDASGRRSLLSEAVEVHAQAVAQQRALCDRAHRVDGDDGHALALADVFAGHGGDEGALAGTRASRSCR
jgi:hypothetical protein